ncbi:MAG: aldehyde dehydrogenase family protein [Pseudomonadota bacterium]
MVGRSEERLTSSGEAIPHFVGGHEMRVGDIQSVEDPATGDVVGSAYLADAALIDRAVSAARVCCETRGLTRLSPFERAALMRRIAEAIRAVAEDDTPLLSLESGKPLSAARDEYAEAALYFDYYAGLADKLEGVSIPLGDGYVDYTIREPYGVSAQIVPWNFPVSIAARGIAPALAAGNAVVVKAPELDPLALLRLGLAFRAAGLPEGAVSIVNGLGTVAGAALAAHPGVDQIVFTGSVPTGQAILRAAAETIVPCVMELGGKSAGLVMADADAEAVLGSVVTGTFYNAGQTCSALTRLLVHRSRYEEIVEGVARRVDSMSVGAAEGGAEVTPLISAAQRDKVASLIDRAIEEGARRVAGDRPVPQRGHFIAPTVLADVAPGSEIERAEVFGPVLSITPFDEEDEAVAIANGGYYGLVAGVFTTDLATALRLPPRLHAGQVFVNEWFAGGVSTPFGGVRRSGYGREKGIEGLFNYLRTKNVAIRL